MLGFSVGSALVSPLTAWYSRRRERAADRYAIDVTGRGEVFARALERLVDAEPVGAGAAARCGIC